MPETVHLSDIRGLLQVEFPRRAMEIIRQRACAGLMALPRVGMGVGGLLLGVREGDRVRLTGSVGIPCTHSHGPSFNLTRAEKDHARALIAKVGEARVIGWYCSKPRDPVGLAGANMALYQELFPKPEQIALMMRPSTVENTRAAFFFRDEKGQVVKGPECDLEEWFPPQKEAEPAVLEPAVLEPAVNNARGVTKPVEIPALAAAAALAPTAPSQSVPGPDMFASYARAPRPTSTNGWVLSGAAMLALAAAAFVTQESWIPRPPLTLTSTESNGNLLIRWNVDALRGLDGATLFVNDGGSIQTLTLDRSQLNQGFMRYSPKSERVTAKLSAGGASAIAAWLSPNNP
jgi:hypothetical protein